MDKALKKKTVALEVKMWKLYYINKRKWTVHGWGCWLLMTKLNNSNFKILSIKLSTWKYKCIYTVYAANIYFIRIYLICIISINRAK